jgi:predicted transcriptional regulator
MDPVDVVSSSQPLDAIAALDARTTSAVPVVDDGRVVGLVRFNDVARLAERALRAG